MMYQATVWQSVNIPHISILVLYICWHQGISLFIAHQNLLVYDGYYTMLWYNLTSDFWQVCWHARTVCVYTNWKNPYIQRCPCSFLKLHSLLSVAPHIFLLWRCPHHSYHSSQICVEKSQFLVGIKKKKKTISVALSPQANFTDWATATCPRNLVPTFVDKGVSRGQRGGSPTVVNLSFLDWSCYFSFK
jgi:hypothetical protein